MFRQGNKARRSHGARGRNSMAGYTGMGLKCTDWKKSDSNSKSSSTRMRGMGFSRFPSAKRR